MIIKETSFKTVHIALGGNFIENEEKNVKSHKKKLFSPN